MRCYRQGQDIKAVMLESMYPAWIMTSHGYIDGFHKSSPSLLCTVALFWGHMQLGRNCCKWLGEWLDTWVRANILLWRKTNNQEAGRVNLVKMVAALCRGEFCTATIKIILLLFCYRLNISMSMRKYSQ